MTTTQIEKWECEALGWATDEGLNATPAQAHALVSAILSSGVDGVWKTR